MKLKKRLPWYYWIPVIGILPVIFKTGQSLEDLFNTPYFEYQIIIAILTLIVLTYIIDHYCFMLK